MIIEKQLTPYVVLSHDPILSALNKITANRSRVIFCVSEHGHLDGVLSDGDFRRWVSGQAHVDLTTATEQVANRDFVSAHVDTPVADLVGLFTAGIDHVPLVDDYRHLVAVAINRSDVLRIGRHAVGGDEPALIISEIGINHNGSVDAAKHLVDLSVESNADLVKFQLRDLNSLYRDTGGVGRGEDLGPQYTLDLLSRFNLSAEQLFEVFDHCRDVGIDVICTPWDPPSIAALAGYGVPAFKIASADLTNHVLLSDAASYGTPMIMSTGMSTEAEIRDSVNLVRRSGTPFAVLHCQSTYPAPFSDINLRYLSRLAEIVQAPVGYSGHERGIHIPVAAVALGAKIIEKHFTTDRSLEGNDHKVSLLPGEFAQMVRRVREVEEALGDSAPRSVSTGEMMNRVNLAKSLIAARRIEVGDVIGEDDVDVKSPGRGLQPNRLGQLVGRRSNRVVERGDFFYPGDLTDTTARARSYSFRRPWGLPVRYHDFAELTAGSEPDFIEFHFSYSDLDIDPASVFRERLPMAFACHSPDLFAGDFLLNLASDDDAHWERSIAELQRVIDTTRSMRDWFAGGDDPVVIASLGGFTADAHLPKRALEARYERVAKGLARIDDAGVRLCAQTLPPFPWYMGGQLYCNLFVGPADTAEFACAYDRRLVLDVSHTKLASNFLGVPFSESVDLLGPHTEHLHLVDAKGVSGEGVQIGDGEVDFAALARQLDELAPQAGFIPEIWQGHVNRGEGFWVALERLEQWW